MIGSLIRSKKSQHYLLLFLLLCFSGNPIIVQLDFAQSLYLIFFMALLVLVVFKLKIGLVKKFLAYIYPYSVIFLLQMAFIEDFSIDSVLFILIKTFIGLCVYEIIGHEFIYKYFHLMVLLSLLSLILYSYNSVFGMINGIQTAKVTNSVIIYTQIFGDNTFINRNCGMFWEPGAFQAYINLSLLFIIPYRSFFYKHLWQVSILVLALFSTYSTTGYAVFALLVFYFIVTENRMHIISKLIILVLFILLVMYFYSTLDFMKEKIMEQATQSDNKEGRLTDFRRFSSLFFDNMFLGRSYITGLLDSGNGFLAHLLSVGIFGAIYYYIMVFINVLKQTSGLYALLFVVTIIMLLQGEGLLSYPMFLAFPFIYFKKTVIA